MTIGELMAIIQTMDPNHEAFVALFTPDGTVQEFDIDAVRDDQGDAQLDIYAEEESFDEEEGNGVVRPEDTVSTPEAAEAAADAFLDFCERRGISEEEKDLIWNAMAFLCYEQVQQRQGPFYEAIKSLLGDDAE
ncbi:MAG TPA: hypothetical protein VLK82_09515 [Candidatus Tectomicrobia bacterium]|nr:hypothetical protein [Candidatus Tectomicrobia bacterium]